MYENHFGLSKNPFQSIAEGEAVFEGPAQTKVIADLKMALTAKDSIAVITGPVGVGKTTIVQRALEQTGPERLVAILGRTQVGSDELVDVLLAQFGVVREPTRRFECLKTFNRILNERAAAGARVFIVIEDAERLGADLLEELEALTAADGGACAGANIVLMGPQKLDKLIAIPALERVRQRIRLQQTLERFTAEDVELYLHHRIKAAGGDFNAIFEPGASMMVRRCTGGIPRVINSLCETALTVAAESKMTQVSGKIVFKVAVEVFGMAPGDAPAPQVPTTAPVARPAEPAPKPAPAPAPKTPDAAAKKPAEAKKPASLAAKPAPGVEKNADPTVPVPKIAAAPEPKPEPLKSTTPRAPKPPASAAKPAATPATPPAASNGAGDPPAKPKAEPSRLPDVPGLGVQDKSAAAAETKPAEANQKPATDKPLPELPPKFKFADEIVVDRDTKPKSPVQPPRQIDPPELPSLKFDDGVPKISDEKPAARKAPAPPSAAADDIPTLGDSARVERIVPEIKKVEERPAVKPAATAANPAATAANPAATAANPAATPAAQAPAQDTPEISLEEPSPPADRPEPKVDEPTASFAKVDHDMLDAALASLAVHDEEDQPQSVEAEMIAATDDPMPASIPEVTLDKSIEAKRAEAKTATDPAVLDQMAAELEKTRSLEDMSDQLAETLFGSEELEAISLQIREKAAPMEESPVALEAAEATGTADPADAAATPTPEVAKASAEPASPSIPEPPATPKLPAAPKPAATAANPAATATNPAATAANPAATAANPAAQVEMSREPAAAAAPSPANNGPHPEPIENQFDTSMTATLKTLNSRSKPPADDADSEESSGGLLGRLKDTFKS